MTENEIELMRALTAMQAALWDVVDGEHRALQTLRIMAEEVVGITQAIMEEDE